MVQPCLLRPLAVNEDGKVPCTMVEATKDPAGCDRDSRGVVGETAANATLNALKSGNHCAGGECNTYSFCAIPQVAVTDREYAACVAGEGSNGWCYADEALFSADAVPVEVNRALETCPSSTKRRARFTGAGNPDAGSLTFLVCGAP